MSLRLLYLAFRRTTEWLALLGRSSAAEDVEILVLRHWGVMSDTGAESGGTYVHRSVDYTCGGRGGQTQTNRTESVQRSGPPILFVSDVDPAATPEQRRLAGSILAGIRVDS